MVKKRTGKETSVKVKVAERLHKAEGELTKNEENLERMLRGATLKETDALEFGENYPLSVQKKLVEIELAVFRSEPGIAALRKLKIIKRLKSLAKKE
ncbi:MAG: hypothetical protein Kow0090_13350 [Myxococcota bacterium]